MLHIFWHDKEMKTESKNKPTLKQLIQIVFWIVFTAGIVLLLMAKAYMLFQLWSN
jgi:hypothetical protein